MSVSKRTIKKMGKVDINPSSTVDPLTSQYTTGTQQPAVVTQPAAVVTQPAAVVTQPTAVATQPTAVVTQQPAVSTTSKIPVATTVAAKVAESHHHAPHLHNPNLTTVEKNKTVIPRSGKETKYFANPETPPPVIEKKHKDVKVKKVVHKPKVHEETVVQKHVHPVLYKENVVEVHKHPQYHERQVVGVKEEKAHAHATKQKETIVHNTEVHEKNIVQEHQHPEIHREKVVEVHKHPEMVDRKVAAVKEGHGHLVDKTGVKQKVLHKPKLHEQKVVEVHEHPEIHHENVVEVHKRKEALDRKVVEKKEMDARLKKPHLR